MRFKIILFLLMAFIGFSCVNKDKIIIKGVEKVDIRNITKPELGVNIENRTGKNIRILEGKFKVMRSGREIAEIMLADEVIIARKSDETIYLPLRLKISDPLAALTGALFRNTENLTITGETRIKMGAVKKKFTFEDLPVSRILTTFGTAKNLPEGKII